MRELAKAGIIDLSEDFYHRFYFRPDLLEQRHPMQQNLLKAIERGLANIRILHDVHGYRFDAVYYIFQTRQGIHIEIPQDIVAQSLHSKKTTRDKIVKGLYDLNRKKLETVSRFYQA